MEVEEDRVPQQVGRGSPHRDRRRGGCRAVEDDGVADGVRGADEASRVCVATSPSTATVTSITWAKLSSAMWRRCSVGGRR